jgi:uncharacterized protein (DUF4415 family)
MPEKPSAGPKPWVDPDDAPELTDEFFARADAFEGDKLIRRGRPLLAEKKQQVTLRLDPTVLAGLRATGPGWQTKANAVLKTWLASQKRRRTRRAAVGDAPATHSARAA